VIEISSLRANQWLRLPLPKWPNWIGVFPPSPEDGNRSSFRNVVFYSFQNTGHWTKSKNPVILTVTIVSLSKYCNLDARSIARQRLSKQARNKRGQQHSRRGVFYVVRATQQKCFLCGPRHPTVQELFSAWSVLRLYNENVFAANSTESRTKGIIIVAERRKQSGLGLGAQKSTGGQKTLRVIWRLHVCYSAVVLGVCDLGRPLWFPCFPVLQTSEG
jgi:hypothetical protein